MSAVLNCLNNVTISDQITEVLSLGAIHEPVQGVSSPNYQYTNGTSSSGTVANQIDLHWELSGATAVTLAASASVTYTLSSLTDSATRPITLARVMKFFVWLISRTDGDYLSVGNAASHPWTGINSSGTATIPVHDALCIVSADKAGLVVSSGSADQVMITNAGSNPITFGINISGCST